MARIRTIKPEFWTSEQVADCSPTARLLFIGMWNFCDDQGVHPASAKRLKMEVFPADSFSADDIEKLVDELRDAGLLTEFTADGSEYWSVTGWKHQKIEKPSNKYPSPPNRRGVKERSTNGRRTIADNQPPEGKGRESKGEEGNSVANATGASAKTVELFPEQPRPAEQSTAKTEPDLTVIPLHLVSVTDFGKAVFGPGLAFVMRLTGKGDVEARKIIGKWRQPLRNDDRRLWELLVAADRIEPQVADLPSWMAARLKPQSTAPADDGLGPVTRALLAERKAGAA